MDSTDDVIASLDRKISAIRSELTALHRHRTLLQTAVLTSSKIRRRVERAKRNSTTFPSFPLIPSSKIDAALSSLATTDAQHHSNVYRSLSGITAFRVRDPDPHAVDGGEVLGLRFDVFSVLDREFVRPYYVLLNAVGRTQEGEKRLRVHKHTIPVFVSLRELEAKHLPVSGEEQDLVKLARELRRELVSFHRRREAVERLKREAKNARNKIGVKEVGEVDPSAQEFEMTFEDESVAKVRIDINGAILNAVVRTHPTDGSGERGESVGRRKRDLERAIVGGNGRIESLPQRLREKHWKKQRGA